MAVLNLVSSDENDMSAANDEKIADFAEKYELYCDLVYKICIVRLGSKENAEDAMQNVFVKLYSKSPVFSTVQEEKAWIIRVAINMCKDFQKSFWQRNTIGLDEISEISDGGFEEQKKVEKALEKAELFYSKDVDFDESNKLFSTIYDITVLQDDSSN